MQNQKYQLALNYSKWFVIHGNNTFRGADIRSGLRSLSISSFVSAWLPQMAQSSRIQITNFPISRGWFPRKIWALPWLGRLVLRKINICWLAYTCILLNQSCGKEGGVTLVSSEHSGPIAVVRHGVSFPERHGLLERRMSMANPEVIARYLGGQILGGQILGGHEKDLQKPPNMEFTSSQSRDWVFFILNFLNIHS